MSTLSSPVRSRVAADTSVSRRLHDQHKVVIDALGGKIVLPPIDLSQNGLRVLESGTADGHWLFDLENASSGVGNTYVGTDVNPKFFPLRYDSSFEFYQHNMADPWPVEDHHTYDLVHQRLSLPGAAPSGTLSQAVHNLFALVKPGGWIQLVEAEQICSGSGPVFEQCVNLVRAVFEETGAGSDYAQKMKSWLEAEGAINIQEVSYDLCFGATQSRDDLQRTSATSTAEAFTGLAQHAKAMGVSGGLSNQDIESLGARTLDELLDLGAHYPLRAVWGQKMLQ